MTPPRTFQVGHTYIARSVGDWDCVWRFTVVRRTAKFVTLRDADTHDEMRVGVRVDDDGEWTFPFGTYSMAPILRARREAG